MTAADDRADQIRARLAQDMDTRADVEWLLAECDELRADIASRVAGIKSYSRRVAELKAERDEARAERTELLRRVEQAERAGAVKDCSKDWLSRAEAAASFVPSSQIERGEGWT